MVLVNQSDEFKIIFLTRIDQVMKKNKKLCRLRFIVEFYKSDEFLSCEDGNFVCLLKAHYFSMAERQKKITWESFLINKKQKNELKEFLKILNFQEDNQRFLHV